MDRLSWRVGSGALEEWLAGTFDRFAVSPEEFVVRRGKLIPIFGGPPNGHDHRVEARYTHPRTVDALVTDLVDDNVVEVSFTVHSPGSWWLRAIPRDRSEVHRIWVTTPGTLLPDWPLPATVRDSRDLRQALVALAGMLGAPLPDDDQGNVNERYPQPVEITGDVDSDEYGLRVAGWGRETIHLAGKTVRLVDDLVRQFQTPNMMPVPPDPLGDLADMYDFLMIELGRQRPSHWAEPPPVLGDIRLPPDTRLAVTRTQRGEPAIQVTAQELLIEADHPAYSLAQRITLVLCPQLYTPCAPADLRVWLRSLEKCVFGRSGIWTVRGRGWRPPRHRGATMVARALLEQNVAGRASVELAGAEFLAVQGLLLNGEPVELAGRSKFQNL